MALFSENIVYRSPLSAEKVLERVGNAIETKGITHLEYWTEPAKFFSGKITGNSFKLTYTGSGRSIDPDIEGIVLETEEGSSTTVQISFPGSSYSIIILFGIALLLTLYVGFGSGLLMLLITVPITLFNLISYKWKCISSEVLLEEIFQVKGEKQ